MSGDTVTVAWVHGQQVAYSWFASMLELQAHLMMGGRAGGFIAMRYGSGGIVEARNKVAAQMLGRDADWLFWIDTDMGFTADTIDRLLEVADPVKRPVVGGLCFLSFESSLDGMGGYDTEPVPTVYRWSKQPTGETGFTAWVDYPRDTLIGPDEDVTATGSACILIHRSVFERIGEHWYTPKFNPDTGQLFGEDLSFCLRLVEHDIPLHIHTGVKTTHLKPIWLSETHFDQRTHVDSDTRESVTYEM